MLRASPCCSPAGRCRLTAMLPAASRHVRVRARTHVSVHTCVEASSRLRRPSRRSVRCQAVQSSGPSLQQWATDAWSLAWCVALLESTWKRRSERLCPRTGRCCAPFGDRPCCSGRCSRSTCAPARLALSLCWWHTHNTTPLSQAAPLAVAGQQAAGRGRRACAALKGGVEAEADARGLPCFGRARHGDGGHFSAGSSEEARHLPLRRLWLARLQVRGQVQQRHWLAVLHLRLQREADAAAAVLHRRLWRPGGEVL